MPDFDGTVPHTSHFLLPTKDANGTVQPDEHDWNYSSYVITPFSADRGARSGRPRGTLSED
jgi:hypothetical protein